MESKLSAERREQREMLVGWCTLAANKDQRLIDAINGLLVDCLTAEAQLADISRALHEATIALDF